MSLQNQMRELLPLDKRALLAREDETELEALMREYRPLILARVLQFCQSADDDYLEAGFLAFAEAIRFYDAQKGSFIGFAQNVIKRRLIDVSRKKPGARELLLGDDTEGEEALLRAAALQAHAQKQEQQARCEEIAALQNELAVYQLRFSDLEAAAPKQERTREQCKKAITMVLSSQRLRAAVLDGRVPCKELAAAQGVSPKVMERHRRYILAAVLVHCGDYPLIQGYIPLQTRDDTPHDSQNPVDADAHMKPATKNRSKKKRSEDSQGNTFQNLQRMALNTIQTFLQNLQRMALNTIQAFFLIPKIANNGRKEVG